MIIFYDISNVSFFYNKEDKQLIYWQAHFEDPVNGKICKINGQWLKELCEGR